MVLFRIIKLLKLSNSQILEGYSFSLKKNNNSKFCILELITNG